jgi:hypothetical protein
MPQRSGYSLPDENGKMLMTVHGRLQHGQLHGMVLVYGILSNDPQSLCSRALFTGLEFVGHYNHGQPKGICWKRLIGESWIYGEVDSEGEFTGTIKTLPPINYDHLPIETTSLSLIFSVLQNKSSFEQHLLVNNDHCYHM